MRISTPVTSRARKDNTVSQCVTRTRRECRGLIVSAIREIVPMAHGLCTAYPRGSNWLEIRIHDYFPIRLSSSIGREMYR